MKIGIDTSILQIDHAGASVYTRGLVKSLLQIDRSNSYSFFSYKYSLTGGNYFGRKLGNVIMDTIWIPRLLPKELKKGKVDLLHCPAFKAPLKCDVPLVATFYDLHILKNPKDYNPWLRYYCKFMLPKIARRADKIITISEFSRNDIINTFSLPAEKVRVTYCGIDDRFRLIPDDSLLSRARVKYGLSKKFILYVGALQPRKNIPLLLKAYAKLLKEQDFDHQLVLAGGTGWRNRNIFSLINELNLSKNVKILGYVPDDDLPLIYALAQFLVYPSFFEGFGLPVIEAMACGCPVICSNAASLPEIVQDCAVVFDPLSRSELENAIAKLGSDGGMRQKMKEKGIKRSADFSWEKSARKTIQVYEEFKK